MIASVHLADDWRTTTAGSMATGDVPARKSWTECPETRASRDKEDSCVQEPVSPRS